jgi:NRPS condensation-like uncharacterized protein
MPRTERIRAATLDIAVHSLRSGCDDLIHAVVTFKGRLDEERLGRAALLTFEAEPVMGSAFHEHWLSPYWEPAGRAGPSEFLEVIDEDPTEENISSFLVMQHDPASPPQVRLRILRGQAGDTLIAKVEHRASDAAGVRDYLELLSSCYRRLEREPAYKPEPAGGSRDLWQVCGRLGLMDWLRVLRRSKRDLKSKFIGWDPPPDSGRRDTPTYLFRRIEKEDFSRMRAFTSKRGATFNDLLLAALLRGFHKIAGPSKGRPISAICTADLRRYLPEGRAGGICNLSGFVYATVGRTLGDTLEETLERVRSDMAFRKADCLGLGDSPGMLALSNLMPFAIGGSILHFLASYPLRSGKLCPIMTNMGEISRGQVGFGPEVLDAYLTAPMGLAGLLAFPVGITSFEGSVMISAGLMGGEADRAGGSRILDTIIQELLP